MSQTRLETLEANLEEIKEKVVALESEFEKAKEERSMMKTDIETVKQNTDDILSWINGGKKVFGFAILHWKTALKFGAGFMTAAGLGNPTVIRYVQEFFGLL